MNHQAIVTIMKFQLSKKDYTKLELKKLPVFCSVNEIDFELCYKIIFDELNLKERRKQRKELSKEYKSVTIQIPLNLWDKLKEYEYQCYSVKTKPQIYILDLIKQALKTNFRGGLKTNSK